LTVGAHIAVITVACLSDRPTLITLAIAVIIEAVTAGLIEFPLRDCIEETYPLSRNTRGVPLASGTDPKLPAVAIFISEGLIDVSITVLIRSIARLC
jgi:hypothetical protein